MRKLLSVFAAFAMALTILTGSIALPLLIRPFYRAQIEPLGIPARSGLTVEQIVRSVHFLMCHTELPMQYCFR